MLDVFLVFICQLCLFNFSGSCYVMCSISDCNIVKSGNPGTDAGVTWDNPFYNLCSFAVTSMSSDLRCNWLCSPSLLLLNTQWPDTNDLKWFLRYAHGFPRM